MVLRVSLSGFIEPCLPTQAERPPSGPGWVHEIKHDGFRMVVRRDPAGVRLLTRRGNDWTERFPLIAAAAGALKVRSCLLDGEAVACDGDGKPSFDRLRYRRADGAVFLFAFDLIELDGRDLRHEPLEARKATLASLLRKAGPGLQFNDHLEHEDGDVVFRHARNMGLEGIAGGGTLLGSYGHCALCGANAGIRIADGREPARVFKRLRGITALWAASPDPPIPRRPKKANRQNPASPVRGFVFWLAGAYGKRQQKLAWRGPFFGSCVRLGGSIVFAVPAAPPLS